MASVIYVVVINVQIPFSLGNFELKWLTDAIKRQAMIDNHNW